MIKIKIIQNVLERNFTVKYKGKVYYVGYLNSDGQILGLSNRDYWEILDEELEELCVCEFQDDAKKEKAQTKKNRILADRLIDFCLKQRLQAKIIIKKTETFIN